MVFNLAETQIEPNGFHQRPDKSLVGNSSRSLARHECFTLFHSSQVNSPIGRGQTTYITQKRAPRLLLSLVWVAQPSNKNTPLLMVDLPQLIQKIEKLTPISCISWPTNLLTKLRSLTILQITMLCALLVLSNNRLNTGKDLHTW